jgi:ParB-like chromosome segregation protein Spo0J
MKFELLPGKAIKIGTRHRGDSGDLEALAASIADVGLLQPIAVDRYYNLICGWRRLRAWYDILHRKEPIPAVVLDLESLLAGEFSENEFRKAFTKTERTAIGKALEAEAGGRRGKRTDKAPDSIATKLGENFPQVQGERNPRTRDLAAKVAGFKNPRTYEQAKRVVERGTPELQAAMDTGEVSVSGAAALAVQPAAEQNRVLAMPKDERRAALGRIRKTKADQELNDKRAHDVVLFRGLSDAVHLIAWFAVDPKETWAGISRVWATEFADDLGRAIDCLVRIRKAHPNEPLKPSLVQANRGVS